MAPCSPSNTICCWCGCRCHDLEPHDSPPGDYPPLTSQGGSSNGPKADVVRKKEVDHLLAKLEQEGLEIDGKIASIIDDEIDRIKPEAERANINEQTRKRIQALLTIAGVAVGFVVSVKCEIDKYRKAFAKIYGKLSS